MNEEQKEENLEQHLRQKLIDNVPPVDLEEFTIELHLAMDVFFMGKTERRGNTITLKIPNGQKFRITTELIS